MTRVHVELDGPGIMGLLSSPEVEDLLRTKAEAVADAARSRGLMVDGKPGDVALPIEVVKATTERARYLVVADHPSGLAVESKHRLLVGSLGAARNA